MPINPRHVTMTSYCVWRWQLFSLEFKHTVRGQQLIKYPVHTLVAERFKTCYHSQGAAVKMLLQRTEENSQSLQKCWQANYQVSWHEQKWLKIKFTPPSLCKQSQSVVLTSQPYRTQLSRFITRKPSSRSADKSFQSFYEQHCKVSVCI